RRACASSATTSRRFCSIMAGGWPPPPRHSASNVLTSIGRLASSEFRSRGSPSNTCERKTAMNLFASLLIACSLAAQTPPVQVQTPPTGKPALPKPDQPPAHYSLGPGDQLKISVFGEEGMENQTYTIDSDGSITFPRLNRIAASGL